MSSMDALSTPRPVARKRSIVFIDTFADSKEPQWLTLTPSPPSSEPDSERSLSPERPSRRSSSVYDISSPQYRKAMEFERLPKPSVSHPALPSTRGFIVAAGDRLLRLQD